MPVVNVFKTTRSTDNLKIDYNEHDVKESILRGISLTQIMNRTFMGKVWHAFTSLPQNEQGLLNLSKAKVLTQNLASVLKTATDVISDFEFTFSEKFSGGLQFEDYSDFLNKHLLTKITALESENEICDTEQEVENEGDVEPEPAPEDTAKQKSKPKLGDLDKQKSGSNASMSGQSDKDKSQSINMLDQLCWTLYSKQALDPRYYEEFSEHTLFSLWLWFVSFADTDNQGFVKYPVTMDGEELNYWLQYLCHDLLALEYRPLDFPTVVALKFPEVLDAMISTKEEWKIDKEELEFVIQELRNEIIDGVLKKGFLYKGKRNLMKSQWKRRYCVLTLKAFAYYSDENMNEKKGQIPLGQVISADPYRDRNSKLTRYQLETNTALFVLEAEDLRSRNQWIRDIRFALRCNVQMVENVHIVRAEERKKERTERRRMKQLDEEERERIKMRIQDAEEANENLNKEIINFKTVLEREEKQRIEEEERREKITRDLQARLESVTLEMTTAQERIEKEKEEQQQELENERNRVQELENMKLELESALLEEQQLRKDEEVVLRMQAELVTEQTKARERLEEIKTEQEELIGEEIQKRTHIETELNSQKESYQRAESLLSQYQTQLQESEVQKAELYKKMAELEAKINNASKLKFTIGSHRGKGAFPSQNVKKS